MLITHTSLAHCYVRLMLFLQIAEFMMSLNDNQKMRRSCEDSLNALLDIINKAYGVTRCGMILWRLM